MLCSKCHCLKYTEKAFELVLREVCVLFFLIFVCLCTCYYIYFKPAKVDTFSHVDSQLEHYVISAVAVQKLQLCYVFIVSGLTALTACLLNHMTK